MDSTDKRSLDIQKARGYIDSYICNSSFCIVLVVDLWNFDKIISNDNRQHTDFIDHSLNCHRSGKTSKTYHFSVS